MEYIRFLYDKNSSLWLTNVVEGGIEDEFSIVKTHVNIRTSNGLHQICTKQLCIVQQLLCSLFRLHGLMTEIESKLGYSTVYMSAWTHITELAPAIAVTLLQNIINHLHNFLWEREDNNSYCNIYQFPDTLLC